MERKRIKKYRAGGFTPNTGFTATNVGKGVGAFGGMAGGLIETADMKDGYMSTGGALGSGALKGASMGAAFGPMGMLLGAGLGAAGGLMKKQEINDAEDARQKAIRDEERLRANIENQMKHQQMNAVLDQYPIKGNNTPRFNNGGNTGGPGTPPNGRRWNLADLFRAAPGSQKLIFDEEVQQGYAKLSDEEIQKLIGTAVPMISDIRSADSLSDKINVARNADLSWVKPLREKAGLTKNQIIDKAAEAGMLKKWARMPVKAAAAFMDFELGGPTGGPFDVNRMMVPTYPEGAGADAMPSFNFYADGAPVSAQQYVESLPQGQNINDHSQYWMQQLKPKFDPATGTWSNTGQGAMAQSAYGALRKHEGGGDTDPVPVNGRAKTPEELRAAQAYANQHGTIRQYNPSRWELFKEALHKHNMGDDSTFENVAEMVDPTGISSWDDAYRANQLPSRPYTADQTLDTIGAMPIFGKAKVGLNLGKGSLKAFKHGLKKSGADFLDAAKRGSNYLNVADGLEDETGVLDGYAMGGMSMGPGYEVEGGEMMQYKQGDRPATYGQGGLSKVSSQEFEVKGPTHANGGVKASDDKGARVYSNKLSVDPALMSKLMKL